MATIIGISGPSSSGKTTLTRLLQRIFNSSSSSSAGAAAATGRETETGKESALRTFIIHEDDFYHPDDLIPTTSLPNGTTIQDWDCASAIDIPFLRAALSYVRETGSLPPRLRSKEDQNEVTESGVPEYVVRRLRGEVQGRLLQLRLRGNGRGNGGGDEDGMRVVAFLEGFLLYAPSSSSSSSSSSDSCVGEVLKGKGEGKEENERDDGKEEEGRHALHDVHQLIDLRLFLPAPYDQVKKRRESRSGYVTIGPAPTPSSTTTKENSEDEHGKEKEKDVDLEKEDDRPPQNFWTDPPGYVDDIVWPRYVQDHAWLLLPEEDSGATTCIGVDSQELLKLVGQGVNVRTDAGVSVAPGQGSLPMVDILQWAVEEVMRYLEERA